MPTFDRKKKNGREKNGQDYKNRKRMLENWGGKIDKRKTIAKNLGEKRLQNYEKIPLTNNVNKKRKTRKRQADKAGAKKMIETGKTMKKQNKKAENSGKKQLRKRLTNGVNTKKKTRKKASR